MAIKMTNLSEKVIGVGEATVLPGETKEVPRAFETRLRSCSLSQRAATNTRRSRHS